LVGRNVSSGGHWDIASHHSRRQKTDEKGSRHRTKLVMDIERFHLVGGVGQSHLDERLEQFASRMPHVFDKPNSVGQLKTDRFDASRVSVSLPETRCGQ
jgi:hypothetical protein